MVRCVRRRPCKESSAIRSRSSGAAACGVPRHGDARRRPDRAVSEMGSEWIMHARLGDDFIPFREKSGAVNGAGTKMEAKSPENNTEIFGTPVMQFKLAGKDVRLISSVRRRNVRRSLWRASSRAASLSLFPSFVSLSSIKLPPPPKSRCRKQKAGKQTFA